MSGGLWHACECGCDRWHRVLDGQVQCDHPNFAQLLSEGVPWVRKAGKMCHACLIVQGEGVADDARRQISGHKNEILADMDRAIAALGRSIEADKTRPRIEPGNDAS